MPFLEKRRGAGRSRRSGKTEWPLVPATVGDVAEPAVVREVDQKIEVICAVHGGQERSCLQSR